MIEIKDVSFTYNQAEAPSLSHVSLSIREGECVLLCGKSGCGKTTIGIAEYELTKVLREEFKSSLPTVEEIENELSE